MFAILVWYEKNNTLLFLLYCVQWPQACKVLVTPRYYGSARTLKWLSHSKFIAFSVTVHGAINHRSQVWFINEGRHMDIQFLLPSLYIDGTHHNVALWLPITTVISDNGSYSFYSTQPFQAWIYHCHLHPLQAENCGYRLVVDKDNLKWVENEIKILLLLKQSHKMFRS